MSKTKKTGLYLEALEADGWQLHGVETPERMASKTIPNRNPLNASEDSDIELIVHGMYNTNTFAVALPDGGLLNFVANTMEELKAFEKAINFYDPPF